MTVKSRLGSTAIVLQCLLWSVPSSAQNEETRDLAGFTAIRVSGGIDLALKQADEFAVEVMAPNGDLDEVITELNGDTLVIRRRTRGFSFFGFDDYRAQISLPTLTALTASGGSDVRSEGRFGGDRLAIVASGGSDLRIDVDVDELDIRTSGGSDATIMGRTNVLTAETSGGSDLDAGRLEARDVTLSTSGGSDAIVDARDRLVARASGGSDIVYRGDPDSVEIDAGRSADVRRR